ncbi:MAG: O-antigen ligase family protein [Phycisphaerales bacterium]
MSVTPPSTFTQPTFKHATTVIALLALALACVALRCVSSYDPFPYWSGDPFIVQSPVLGLTPALAIATDTICFAASAAALVLCLTGRTLPLSITLCLIAATLGLTWQQIKPIPSDYWDGIVLSRHWLAGFTLAFATIAASRHAALRRAVMLLTSSTLIGIVLLVLAKGFSQIIFEHPQMLKAFRANKESIIAAQGWDMNSSMARAYTRRLEQPEATGWFGLANIFATLCAAGFTALLTLLATTWQSTKQSRPNPNPQLKKATVILAFCTLAFAAGVYLAGSKGGFAAAALGVLLAGFVWLTHRGESTQNPTSPANSPSRLHKCATWLGPTLVIGALLAIIARGLIGERLGELSLLFRWFYMQGAAKIFAAHPLGVGAAGFKDAYMIYKPALSPEDTSFAHSVLIDWIVALGPIGLIAVAAWFIMLRTASKCLIPSPTDHTAPSTDENAEILLLRNTRSIACFALLAPTALAAFLERDAATPEAGLTRALGIALSLAAAWAMHILLSNTNKSNPRATLTTFAPALATAAIVACVHGQIELTGTMSGSAAWSLALLGAAASLAQPARSKSNVDGSHQTSKLQIPLALIAVLATVLCAVPYFKAASWQRALEVSYVQAAGVQDFVARRNDLATASNPPADPTSKSSAREALVHDLSVALSRPVQPQNQDIDKAISDLQLAISKNVANDLNAAVEAAPLHFPTLRTASRLALATTLQRELAGNASPAELSDPITQLTSAERLFSQNVNYWSWLGTMSRERAKSRPTYSPEATTDLERTITAWTRAQELSPHDTIHALKLSDLYAELGKPAEAREWATKALAANSNMRLDPLRQLTDSERSRLEARAK